MSTPTHLSAEAIGRALELRDLTDPAQGRHAMQLVLDQIEAALHQRWRVPVRRERAHPVVSIRENYDLLRVPADAVAREARYTRYLNDTAVLRTHTTAVIARALRHLGEHDPDVLLSCPGLTYRRDVVDRRHVGEPHQLDLWRIRTAGPALTTDDLGEMIRIVVGAALPGRRHRTTATQHPYTLHGRQIDVADGEDWVEVGECGLAHPGVLARGGLDGASGLAMGLGLDRLVMLRKGIGDIRLLRSADPRVAEQMLDLDPYRPVSAMPPVRRDLSIAVAADVGHEELGDRVRDALGEHASAIEEIEIVGETPHDELPDAARARMGMSPGQKNVLVRLVIRDLERTLTDAEANAVRDLVYGALHEGSVPEVSPSRARPRRTGRRRRG